MQKLEQKLGTGTGRTGRFDVTRRAEHATSARPRDWSCRGRRARDVKAVAKAPDAWQSDTEAVGGGEAVSWRGRHPRCPTKLSVAVITMPIRSSSRTSLMTMSPGAAVEQDIATELRNGCRNDGTICRPELRCDFAKSSPARFDQALLRLQTHANFDDA
jgi:hypothetical protein